MDLHPALQRKLKTFPYAALFEAFAGLFVAGVTEEQGDNVAAHVVFVGVNLLRAPFVSQLQALFVEFHCQVGTGEEVDVLVVVRGPELGAFDQNIFYTVDVKKAVATKGSWPSTRSTS